MASKKTDLIQGTLNLLILKTVAQEPLHTSRVLSAIVYQASARDPFVLTSVALTMLVTGLLSVTGPVRRALHIDPATLLREQ